MNKTTPIESKDNYSWLDDVLSGYKLRDKILPIYRPLFDPTIGAEHLSHLLSQCTIEVLQVSNDLKQTIISQIRIERAEAIESFKKVNKILDREIEIEKLRASEIFIPVRDYEGLYEVSNTGKVRSLARKTSKGGELKQSVVSGYLRVSLSNGKPTNQTVHRLVAKAFLSNPENKPCVNHKDGNRLNNNVDNLEWCTYSENELHSYNVLGKVNSNDWRRFEGTDKKPNGGVKKGNHCGKGHEYTPENTFWKKDHQKGRVYDTRICRTCRRNWKLAYMKRQEKLKELEGKK